MERTCDEDLEEGVCCSYDDGSLGDEEETEWT